MNTKQFQVAFYYALRDLAWEYRDSDNPSPTFIAFAKKILAGEKIPANSHAVQDRFAYLVTQLKPFDIEGMAFSENHYWTAYDSLKKELFSEWHDFNNGELP